MKTDLRFQIFAETTLKYGDGKIKHRDMKSRKEARKKKRKEKGKGGRESDDTYTPAPAVCVQAQNPPSAGSHPALQCNKQEE